MNEHTSVLNGFTTLGGNNELLESQECIMIKTLQVTLNKTTSKGLFLID